MENLLRQAGACAVGCVAAQRLRQHMSEEAWARAEQNTPGLKRLLCAAFPYGPERPTPGKLSLYARGADYHQVLRERLAPVAWGRQRTKWLDSIIHSMDMSLSKFQETVNDREAWHAAVLGVTESQI